MSPRTNSPPPSFGPYDDINNDFDYPPGYISQTNLYPSQQQQQNNITPSGSNVSRSDVAGTSSTRNNSNNDNEERGLFTSLLQYPLNIPRRVLSSSVVKGASLMVLYSFCITTVCCIFFISYLLTFYDDTRRLFRSSRVWAQLKSGVRERIAMMGEDWEEFLQKYFDQAWDGVDVNRNAHLGGGNNNNNNSSSTSSGNDANSKGDPEGIPNLKDLEWLKGAMLGFMAVVAGQDATNKFQESFRSQPPTAATTNNTGGDAGKKNN